ncbi:MAG TPA: alanine dehydrogenase [Actinomycetota bacterium]|jgi:alanine dehydrogenase|nr:alanine dehydrogenase [Actinomycetota bacterium]
MAQRPPALTFGLPRMHKEEGERRDFLPALVGKLIDWGAQVIVERGIGSGMGFRDNDYLEHSPLVRAVANEESFRADIVLTLRCPDEAEFVKLRPGAILFAMLHFPTRPQRVARLRELGIEAISMDSITDDAGRRLVVDSRDVAWNGLEAAFDALERTWPELADPSRRPVRVTVMGAGQIGKHAVEAATKYGNLERNERFARLGVPGVEVVTLGRNLTGIEGYLRERLRRTDVLVDVTQRDDASRPIVPNAWIGDLPQHAVICDLVVDPYLLDEDPPTVRGIEGIPQGNLDRWVFAPDDRAWDELPAAIPSAERRTVVSCYSWPGVHPVPCMELYGAQLAPLLEALIRVGGMDGLHAEGSYHERALHRASLRAWAGPG